jgi:hypothetical protein
VPVFDITLCAFDGLKFYDITSLHYRECVFAYSAYGSIGMQMVDLSIVLSQMGYCVTYFTYVYRNIQAALLQV